MIDFLKIILLSAASAHYMAAVYAGSREETLTFIKDGTKVLIVALFTMKYL